MNTDNFPDRLKHFIESQNITSSIFADSCGIARPTLSQILTGRNKKISDVIISRIHSTYPDLNILWLLFGEGEMYDSTPKPEAFDPEMSGADSISFVDVAQSEIPAPSFVENSSNPTNRAGSGASVHENTSSQKLKSEQVINNMVRKISHITVYYDDQTFETFYPKK